MNYSIKQPGIPFRYKLMGIIVAVLVVVGGGGYFGFQRIYQENLSAPGDSRTTQLFAIETGATTQSVANQLEQDGLIQASWAFSWYMRTQGLRGNVQAGTYALSPSQSVEEIAAIITRGQQEVNDITILPEKRLDQLEVAFINAGFSPEEVEEALDPDTYTDHPALADKPPAASLEGYIYPETFQITPETELQEMIEASFDEMAERLTPQVRQGIRSHGLSVHEGVILASIVEREVGTTNPDDRPRVAQVFLSRLDIGMKLESNATTFYGAVLNNEEELYERQSDVSYETAYNTYQNEGLPPSPISNVSGSSLEAVARPADTDYLYFVSGDPDENGVSRTYFSDNLAEHERLVQQYCTIQCR